MSVWEDIRIMWDANSCRFGIAYRTQPAAGSSTSTAVYYRSPRELTHE